MDKAPIDRGNEEPIGNAIDGAPVWVRVVQAAVIGAVAGLALNAIVSMVAVHGKGLTPKQATPKECKKQLPGKDSASPKVNAPTTGSVRWTVDTVQASFDPAPGVWLAP